MLLVSLSEGDSSSGFDQRLSPGLVSMFCILDSAVESSVTSFTDRGCTMSSIPDYTPQVSSTITVDTIYLIPRQQTQEILDTAPIQ